MREDKTVQFLFFASPLGQILSHECNKTLIVLFLDQMQKLVGDNILNACNRFLC
jgi:hypothetical protein